MVEAKPGSVRERLLLAADELFYQEGVHTVGIDRVLEKAGVAKASLYGTFGSKDELVRAYLEDRGRAIRERTAKRLAQHDDPRDRVLAIFDLLRERVEDGSYRGCPFVNASAEGKPDSVAKQVAARHRAWRRGLFAELAGALGVRDAAEVGKKLCLLYDGALINAAMDSDPAAAVMARELAEQLIDSSIAKKPARQAKAKRAK